jgi:hypothetical protein
MQSKEWWLLELRYIAVFLLTRWSLTFFSLGEVKSSSLIMLGWRNLSFFMENIFSHSENKQNFRTKREKKRKEKAQTWKGKKVESGFFFVWKEKKKVSSHFGQVSIGLVCWYVPTELVWHFRWKKKSRKKFSFFPGWKVS